MKDMDYCLDKDKSSKPSFNFDQNKFEYSKILSTEESEFQHMHADFGSINGWQDYKNKFETLNMTPLSALYYPEGILLNTILI